MAYSFLEIMYICTLGFTRYRALLSADADGTLVNRPRKTNATLRWRLFFFWACYMRGAINLKNLPALVPNQLYCAQSFNVTGIHFSSVFSKSFSTSARRRDFHRFPWGIEGAMEVAPPEAAPLLGRLCFLSVIDGVAPYQNLISDETAWIKAVSLVFLRSIAWHRAAAPVVCGSD